MTARPSTPGTPPAPANEPRNTPRVSFAVAVRYRLDRELGSRGRATVYHAHDLKLNRDVALWILWPEAAEAIGADVFVREMAIAAELKHPNILPIHDYGAAYATLYYATPLIDGETLRERLKRVGRMQVDDAIAITRGVAAALHYAHTQSVAHRDLKPDNILLTKDDQVLVAEWGIAPAISQAGSERMREMGMSLGVTQYLSPEQATGEHEVTGRSDIFALGCVAYEMLTGEPAFKGATPHAIAAQVITAHPPAPSILNPAIPPYVDAAIRTAIAKRPSDRFASALAFAEAISNPNFIAKATPVLRRPEPAPRQSTGARRASTGATPQNGSPPVAPTPPSPFVRAITPARSSMAVILRKSASLLARVSQKLEGGPFEEPVDENAIEVVPLEAGLPATTTTESPAAPIAPEVEARLRADFAANPTHEFEARTSGKAATPRSSKAIAAPVEPPAAPRSPKAVAAPVEPPSTPISPTPITAPITPIATPRSSKSVATPVEPPPTARGSKAVPAPDEPPLMRHSRAAPSQPVPAPDEPPLVRHSRATPSQAEGKPPRDSKPVPAAPEDLPPRPSQAVPVPRTSRATPRPSRSIPPPELADASDARAPQRHSEDDLAPWPELDNDLALDMLRVPLPEVVPPQQVRSTPGPVDAVTPEEIRVYGPARTPSRPVPIVVARRRRPGLYLMAAVAVVLAVTATAVALRRTPAAALPAVRFTMRFPDTIAVVAAELSGDGATLAFSTTNEDLFTNRLDAAGVTLLRARATSPFFSPDGREVGFTATDSGKAGVMAMPAGGGAARAVAPGAVIGTWGDDGKVYVVLDNGGVGRVNATGGAVEQLLTIDDRIGRVARLAVLPGSKTLLFSYYRGDGEVGAIGALDLSSRTWKPLVRGADGLAYVDPGYVLFTRGNWLMAAPVSDDGLTLEGTPRQVLRSETDAFTFFAHRAQTLVFQAAGAEAHAIPVLRSRGGADRVLPNVPAAVTLSYPRVSPDGKAIAFTGLLKGSSDRSVWVYQLPSGPLKALPAEGNEHARSFTPDGQQILFSSDRSGRAALYTRPWDGSGSASLALTLGGGDALMGSWLPDGKRVVFGLLRSESGAGALGVATIGQPDSAITMLTNGPFHEWSPTVSPDGRWLAYRSDETGTAQIFLRPLDGLSGPVKVSRVGGYLPTWARNGQELYFENDGGDTLYVARVSLGPVAKVQGQGPLWPLLPGYGFDVLPDGQTFVTFKAVGEYKAPPPPMVVVNFRREIEKAFAP